LKRDEWFIFFAFGEFAWTVCNIDLQNLKLLKNDIDKYGQIKDNLVVLVSTIKIVFSNQFTQKINKRKKSFL